MGEKRDALSLRVSSKLIWFGMTGWFENHDNLVPVHFFRVRTI